MHCIALNCITLNCIVLYYIVSYCNISYHIILHHITLHYITLYHIVLCYVVLWKKERKSSLFTLCNIFSSKLDLTLAEYPALIYWPGTHWIWTQGLSFWKQMYSDWANEARKCVALYYVTLQYITLFNTMKEGT